jgi:hypothetical protein
MHKLVDIPCLRHQGYPIRPIGFEPQGKERDMRTKLEVQIAETTELAYTCVPGHVMWELVEYLSMHRTQVYYGYSREGFTVTFLRLGKEAAQELLDGWTDSWMMDPVYEESHVEQRRERYSLAG